MRTNLKFVTVCMSVLFLISVDDSQQKVRTVNEDTYRKTNEPLKVHYVLNNHPLLNNRMSGGADWIKQLSLKVTNISGKAIKLFDIQLIVEKQDAMVNRAAIMASFPVDAEPIFDAAGARKWILEPGESIKVNLRGVTILDRLREKNGVTDISTISLDIRYVDYEDGTRWELGRDYIKNPNNPGHWMPANSTLRAPR